MTGAVGSTPVRPIEPEAPAAGPRPSDAARLRDATRDFEAIFLGALLRTMRDAVAQKGIFRSGNTLRIYGDLADDALARLLARSGGLGLGDVLFRDLSRLLPDARKPSSSGPGAPMARTDGSPGTGEVPLGGQDGGGRPL